MRYAKQTLIRQEDFCMFFDYARPNYNVNNTRCVYPKIETLYTFSLVVQEAILNMEDLERSMHSLEHLEQHHQHLLLACCESLYLEKSSSISNIGLAT